MEYIARILFFTLTVIFQTVLSISSNFFLNCLVVRTSVDVHHLKPLSGHKKFAL